MLNKVLRVIYIFKCCAVIRVIQEIFLKYICHGGSFKSKLSVLSEKTLE